MFNISELIQKLKSQGYTKYRIAKECKVTWQTVHMWEKEVFKPSEDKLRILTQMLR